jgi:3-oxoadipate enol-lactonase
MERAMPVLLGFDARPWLDSIEVPTLVACGGADPILPIRHAHAVAEAIPGSTFVLVEGAGHVPSTTEPGQVGRAFDHFVERVRP